MPINSKNPGYDISKSSLTKDANDGNVLNYIPRLAGQTNTEYQQYQNRAIYYNITKRTNSALTGAILRKPYTTDINVDDVVIYGDLNFNEFLSETIMQLMVVGRLGMLVDSDQSGNKPYIVSYENQNIINWRIENNVLTLVVLQEDTFVPKEDDPYEYEQIVQYRELYLDENGLYAVNVWRQDGMKNFKIVEQSEPRIRGQRQDHIPFVFVNTHNTTPMVTEPVLYNIAQINISQFKTSADIEHSAHFTALPQPWMSGDLKEETSELPIGTYTVWQLEQDASVGYLEFSGAGIDALQKISTTKEENMVALGASLLQGRKGVESAEALRIRQGSESSTLMTLANSVESAMQQILTIYNNWLGNSNVIEFTLNRDFTAIKLSPQELKALMDAFIAGTISQDTFLQNLYDGEVVKDVEEEKARISNNTAQI